MRVLIATLIALSPSLTAFAGEKPAYEDAPLHAIQFVDAREGWAVGEDGVVWHTIDSGKVWERQATGVRASLRGVHFLNPFTGWVVGRIELPGGRSEGVILVTNTGGEKWQRVLLGALPGLNGVRFVRELEGYLYGDGSEQHPSGVYRTEDGGRTWHPVPGPRATTWRTGCFTPTGDAAFGGAWNRLAALKNGRVTTSEIDTLGGRAISGMYFNGTRGLAVGQGGLILQSDGDFGSTWSYIELPGLDSVRPVWDFHAIAGSGENVWVAGRPGSALLHSPDSGKTWQVLKTGHTAPLNALHFLDARTGYAVGELGTILATVDGGKTWRLQRRGGQRAAVLTVQASPERIPLDTLATLGGAEGYLSVAMQIVAPDPTGTASGRSLQPFRIASGARLAGGAAGELLWAFPLASHLGGTTKDDVLGAWNRLHGDKARDNLFAQMVLALRMWRPNLVLTDGPGSATGLTPAESLVLEVLQSALAKAGDATVCPEQLRILALEPWLPTKAYQQAPPKYEAGRILLDTTEFSPLLGTTPRDRAGFASVSLLREETTIPRLRAYQLLAGSAEAKEHRHLMQGLDLSRGGLARRTLEPIPEDTTDLKKSVQQASNLLAFVENPANDLTDPNKLLGQLGPMLDKLPTELAARTAANIAAQLARNGQWALAREVYQLIVDRYPADTRSIEACRWLMQYHASCEARRRHELNQFVRVGTADFGVVNGVEETIKVKQPGSKKDAPEIEVKVPKFAANQEESQAILVQPGEARRWHEAAPALEKQLASHGPLHSLDPALQLALLAAKRQLGDLDGARKGYALLASRQTEGAWKTTARAELWLLDRTGESPRPVVPTRLTETRPRLDGKLDDACWQSAGAISLQNAVGEPAGKYPTQVRVTHDREFLYVGITCRHPEGKKVEPLRPRLHDRDLSGRDRVSLVLDLDRDYATNFHLTVDQRGCLIDECWGDRTWNPKWFVAQSVEDTGWTTEIAIPLEGLTGSVPAPGTVWAFNAIRTIPGVGVQAVSLPAEVPEDALRTEGLGFLLFQDSKPTGSR